MRTATIKTLAALTNRMYAEQSEQFHNTRSNAWTGWEQCLASLPTASPLRVLDLGCGNGRFGTFLRENTNHNREIEYVGVDTTQELLALAAKDLGGQENVATQFVQLDIIERLLATQAIVPGQRTFDVIALFGVLHHIPSITLRLQLLTELATHLAPQGQLWISFWLFAEHDRFNKKVLAPSDFGVESSDLEVGDFLLPWDTSAQARYCHYADAHEQIKLLAATGLETIDSFQADGKSGTLNQYYVLTNA